MKKVAVFHNFMDNIGGAEMVALTLARELNADIYTTNVDKQKVSSMGFGDIVERIHSIGTIPVNAPLRHQMAFNKFRKLNLGNKYDFYIIAGDWAMSSAVNNKPNLWYVHSPLNELWAFKGYIRKNMLAWWKRPLYDIWVAFNRKLTLKYAASVDQMLCNSVNTKARLKKYYGRDAEVLNPPIYTKDYIWKKSEGYWLSVNRLIPHKRIEIQMEAFRDLPNEKLIIVGSYEKGAKQFESYKEKLEKMKPGNVEIINWADRKTLIDLYSGCKGLIATARDEDFGMSPIEAFASGKPVIAANEGGYKETITANTGIVIDNIDGDKLRKAIIEMNVRVDLEGLKIECRKQSEKFDVSVFIQKIKESLTKAEGKGKLGDTTK